MLRKAASVLITTTDGRLNEQETRAGNVYVTSCFNADAGYRCSGPVMPKHSQPGLVVSMTLLARAIDVDDTLGPGYRCHQINYVIYNEENRV